MRSSRTSARSEREFARALDLHRAGRVEEAEAGYKALVAAEPRHHRSLFALGVIALQSGRDAQAAPWLERAVAEEPGNAAYWLNLGEAHRRLGRLREAGDEIRRALALKPDFAEAHHNLGLVLLQAGDSDAGVPHLAHAVDLKPEGPILHQRLGEALGGLGEPEAGELHLTCALLRSGAAAPTATAADELARARAARASGALVRAAAHCHCALATDGALVGAWVELSGILEALGRVEGAAVASLRALGVDPDCAMAHATLAAARILQDRYEEAIECCRKALAIDTSTWLAHFHLGNALAAKGSVDEAIAAFRRTVEICPDQHAAHSSIVFFMPYAAGAEVTAIGREARAWAQRRASSLTAGARPHANDAAPGRRIRVGFVSPDLRLHPVALFLRPLLAHLDGGAVEAFCYSSSPTPDATTARLRELADGWRDVAQVPDDVLAGLVREDRIDVLVDLTMHASGGRPLLFARKPAPVQVCWLAYAGTTGLGAMDYRITDPHLEPPGVDPAWATEAPLVLPESFWCYEPWTALMASAARAVSALPATRNGHVTFGSQHSIQKVNAEVIAVWAAVLGAVPGSRLRLFAPEPARPSLAATFQREGVTPARIQFLPLQGIGRYLEAYESIDVCLDTFPCNGATSSMDALWMGAPVVTRAGDTPAGRAGLSIATNLGLPELVARTPQEYVAIAVRLTQDLPGLAQLRSGLRARMESSPLMDAPRFARNMEAAFRAAWRTWCARPGAAQAAADS